MSVGQKPTSTITDMCLSLPVGRRNTRLRQPFCLSLPSWSSAVVYVLLLFTTSVTSFPFVEQKVPVVERSRELLAETAESDACHAQQNIKLEGVHIFQRPLVVATHEECCTECQRRDDCAGWVFNACCNHCSLFEKVLAVEDCPNQDCMAGVTSSRERHLQENFHQAPRNRFKGYRKPCNDQALQKLISSVLMACGTVQRDCAPAMKKVKQVPLTIENTIEMYTNTNAPEYDFNDGFREHQLTPEGCHRHCLQYRGCQAWVRTAAGQCWLKYQRPEEENWETIVGDVSGFRTRLNVTCGERVTGIAYDINNPTEKQDHERENPDECCQLCAENPGCVVWSFFEGTCRIIFSLGFIKEENTNATTAFISTEPYDCSGGLEAAATPVDIVRAYNAECASILLRGPGKNRSRCRDMADANNIFDEALDRIQRVF